jgi:hypothetical protein
MNRMYCDLGSENSPLMNASLVRIDITLSKYHRVLSRFFLNSYQYETLSKHSISFEKQ